MHIATVNPANGETVKTYHPMDEDELERRLQLAEATFRTYRTTTFEERSRLLHHAAEILDADQDAVGKVIATEMGKPVKQARAEAAKCAKAMHWYADHAAGLLADEEPDASDVKDSGASRVLVRYRPLGPVLAVMPWNFPLWQVVRFAAPALMAGNVGLLKHASNVPQTALYLEDLFHRAGFTEGCFQTLLIGSAAVDDLLRDERIKAATLTGSEPAGRAVASTCGEMIKKTVLELGGSDPFVVMPSADLDRAAEVAVTARCRTPASPASPPSGSSCTRTSTTPSPSGSSPGMKALKVGDPMDEDTDVGPLSSEQGRRDLEELVDDAVRAGATVLCGGERPDGPGWFYPPTVLAGIDREMRIHREEAFGPVATLYRAADLDEAVLIANDTLFGLSSNVWTRDEAEIDRFVRDLEAGGVYVNGMTASHPAFPFGGVKRSGYGRELSGHGIREFCNITTVWHGA